MPGRHRDPNIGPEEQHPGAPREEEERQYQEREGQGLGGEKRRIGEDRTPGERKPKTPVGNSGLPDEPAVFPPHN